MRPYREVHTLCQHIQIKNNIDAVDKLEKTPLEIHRIADH